MQEGTYCSMEAVEEGSEEYVERKTIDIRNDCHEGRSCMRFGDGDMVDNVALKAYLEIFFDEMQNAVKYKINLMTKGK